MNEFNNFWFCLFDDLMNTSMDYPCTFTTVSCDYPQTNDVVKATVESPLAFNLTTDSDKEVTLELAMAGVKKENLKITKKGKFKAGIVFKGDKTYKSSKRIVNILIKK